MATKTADQIRTPSASNLLKLSLKKGDLILLKQSEVSDIEELLNTNFVKFSSGLYGDMQVFIVISESTK
jgi:hypothetical protein